MTASPHYRTALVAACLLTIGVGCGTVSPPSQGRRIVRASAPEAHAPEAGAPSVYVRLETVADRSARAVPKARRESRANNVRELMVRDLQASPMITLELDEAEALGLRRFTVDAIIEGLDRRVRGPWVYIECELRVTVTDQRGKILSLLTNSSAVRVPRKDFRREYEVLLQRDALEGAAQGINRDLIAFLQ